MCYLSTNCSTLIGWWRGISTIDSFNHYTVIEFTRGNDSGDIILRRHSRMQAVPAEGRLEWSTDNHFRTTISHWILRENVSVNGMLAPVLEKEENILVLRLEGEGMTGLENWDINLRRYEKLQDFDYFQGNTASSRLDRNLSVLWGDHLKDDKAERSELDAAVQQLLVSCHDNTRVEGIIIVKGKSIVAEDYAWGMHKDTQHLISSCTKSVVSILAGIAIDQGLTCLESIISDAFPQSPASPLTLKHALSMMSGTQFGPVESQKLLSTTNVPHHVLSSKRLIEPGKIYNYDNGLPALVGVYIERKAGQALEKFAKQYLFDPLEIKTYRWTYMRESAIDDNPMILTAGGLYLSLRDMASIGVMMLDRGVYGGKRILSEEYISRSTA